jgi:hypothetical protein
LNSTSLGPSHGSKQMEPGNAYQVYVYKSLRAPPGSTSRIQKRRPAFPYTSWTNYLPVSVQSHYIATICSAEETYLQQPEGAPLYRHACALCNHIVDASSCESTVCDISGPIVLSLQHFVIRSQPTFSHEVPATISCQVHLCRNRHNTSFAK